MGYPRKNQGPAKEFSVRVIDELRDMPSDKGDGGTTIRMEAWSVDGKEGQPALAKRDYWNNENGKQSGKAKGFNRADFELILKNRYRIGKAFGMAPNFVDEAMGQAEEMQGQPEPVMAGETHEAADPWK